jgi:hypothetical protein
VTAGNAKSSGTTAGGKYNVFKVAKNIRGYAASYGDQFDDWRWAGMHYGEQPLLSSV